ncbi:MAG: HD domain-containing protein [Rhodocyclaceae bacterium]|nr:MAG: HD domain-containing protein [Rhodocyclaceae bacterium]
MVDNAQDIHYLQHVTALGERRKVVAHAPIFSKTGVKLVEAGVAVSQDLLDKLGNHHLFPMLDECLTVEDALSSASLRGQTKDLLAEDITFGALIPPGGDDALLDAIAAIPLPAPLAFKLTVAREQRPEIFRHSLQVALLAALLKSMDATCTPAAMSDAAAAGLFHDIGLLHIDPAIFDTHQGLTEALRHHLYSHPIIAYLILERTSGINPNIALAVLQHHERMDGSGYPKGLAASQLGELGQILAVAELGATLLAQPSELPLKRHLEVVLRMNADKLQPRYTAHLETLLAAIPRPSSGPTGNTETIFSSLIRLAVAINHWRSVRAQPQQPALLHFIDGRVERLAHALADVGIDLDYWTTYDADIEQDGATLAEIEIVAREAMWQLNALTQEIRRKWKNAIDHDAEQCRPALDWLASVEAENLG